MVKWNGSNKKYYTDLGYKFTKLGDKFYVKIEDLSKGSTSKIKYACDSCGNEFEFIYKDFNRRVNKNNIYCKSCIQKYNQERLSKQCERKTISNRISKSFYDWCIEHDRQDIIDRWDYELNKCSPKDVSYGTGKLFYLKCDKHPNHKSEPKRISLFTLNREEGSIKCRQCNSIAQWFIDNNMDIDKYWDYEKNGDLDPWDVTRRSNKKIWIKCQNKDYHIYEIRCAALVISKGCPYCSGKRLHIKDSVGYFIQEKYGEDYLKLIWSDKNDKSPFDISINSNTAIWIKNKEKDGYKDRKITCHIYVKNNGCLNVPTSFYDWCIEHDRKDIIDRWDYELNKCSPKDVVASSDKKYAFKCDKHLEHKSEFKSIYNLYYRVKNVKLECRQCNSVAQYILDNFSDKNIGDIWDYEKNGDLDPWQVQKCGKSKIWIKCQNTDYHGSYETLPGVFTKGFGCPYCYNRKVHPLDSLGQYIINEYDEDFLDKIWSDKNKQKPFEYSISSEKKVWWRCINGKHDDFLRSCKQSTNAKYRCPKCYRENLSGENSPKWNPNLTPEERERGRLYNEYYHWRIRVYKRDKYFCQCCGKHGSKVSLNAHHLDSYNWCKERRTDVDNGITLCTECHKEFHKKYGLGDNTREQFYEWFRNKKCENNIDLFLYLTNDNVAERIRKLSKNRKKKEVNKI